MRIPPNYRSKALNASKAKARELREALRIARTGDCLIPLNDEDGPCSPELNNCHLIGLNHLRPIAKNGHVYEWDMTQIPNVSTNWIKHGTFSDDPTQISFGEIHPADLNILKCTRRPVCRAHDGPIFRATDRKDLDPHSPENQFMMGFRGIAGSLALFDSLIDFTNSIKGQARLDEFWVSRGQAGAVERNLANAVRLSEQRSRAIRGELTKWQELYLDRDQRGGKIISSVGTMIPKIKVACSSIYYGDGGKPVALNIIPFQSGGKATIIVTARKSNSLIPRFRSPKRQTSALSAIRDQITQMFENDPAIGIIHLIQHTLHLVANKEDFDNPNIITDDERQSIAKIVANLGR